MTDPVTSTAELLRLIVREGRRRILAVSAVFCVVALAPLAVSMLVPKQYEAHAVLLAESRSMIAPLMGSRVVSARASEDAQLVRQAFLTRRVLREVAAAGGWAEQKDPIEEARSLNRLNSRISIQSPRREIIRITYRDTDPHRCLDITNKLAEIYIRESTVGNERESREAFEFIDRQVKEYAAKVGDAHAKVLSYRRGQEPPPDVVPPGRRGQVLPRRTGPRLPPGQIAALTVEETTLSTEVAAGEARRARRAERTAQLERELETLLTSFTENHPQVKRAREELRLQRQDAERADATEEPALRALRSRLEATRRQLATSPDSPIARAADPTPDVAPELRGVGQDSTLSELVRRYEATRQIYQDLLERRENARVSMELEAEHGGVSVRIYEAPELPVLATGLRVAHLVAVGFVLAVAIPVALLYVLVRFDPRVRSPWQLEMAEVPLLVGIPHVPSLRDRLRHRRRIVLATGMVVAMLATYVAFFIVRVKLKP